MLGTMLLTMALAVGFSVMLGFSAICFMWLVTKITSFIVGE